MTDVRELEIRELMDRLSNLPTHERDNEIKNIAKTMHNKAYEIMKDFISDYDQENPIDNLIVLVFSSILTAFVMQTKDKFVHGQNTEISTFDIQNIMIAALKHNTERLSFSQNNTKAFLQKVAN